METVFSLDQIKSHQHEMGEQALQLGLFAQKGYPVLPSAVLSAVRFRNFLETIHWLEPLFADLPYSSLRLNLEDSQQLQTIARQIRQTILHAELPKDWILEIQQVIAQFPNFGTPAAVVLCPSIAVKSLDPSHTLSSQTLMDLIEPQICWTEANPLAIGLKQLWADLFRARNLVYWQGAKIELQQIQFAVLIQPIGSAIVSGSLQGEPPNWELTATRGLSVAILRGEVLPEIYKISQDQIQFQQAGRQTIAYQIRAGTEPLARSAIADSAPVLTVQQRGALFELAKTIQFPARLEWQSYDSQLYLTTVHYSDPIVNSSVPSAHSARSITTGLAAAPGQAIAPAFVLTDANLTETSIPVGSVLVTRMILPNWIPLLKYAAAIVSEQGGMTSHGAILAREMGIPAIVGAKEATQKIHTGEMIIVNGNTGSVTIAAPSDHVTLNSKRINTNWNVTATQLMINLSQISSIEDAAELNVDGIGLLRSELMLGGILEDSSEFVDRLTNQIQQFARTFAPRPVFYRSLDLRSHEFQSLPAEPNPMLGMRGTFSYLQNSERFDLELGALQQALEAGCSNLRLILPFVRTVEEFVFCRRRVEQFGLLEHPQFQLWIMAEVPSVVFLLPEYVRAGVQGICIGTSDLTQLMLGVDRDQSTMAKAFDQTHPAVMNAIEHLIETAHRLNIPCSISTQAALTPEMINRWVEWGIDAISVNVSAVELAHRMIARAEQRILLRRDRPSMSNL